MFIEYRRGEVLNGDYRFNKFIINLINLECMGFFKRSLGKIIISVCVIYVSI